ncbi:MAG: ABC transporter ATP-binding protein, partial [Spirulina sp. SIO3F2]|nr:ABC transporter ATP-binding protein [Spirulina sp. SIO3F2]
MKRWDGTVFRRFWAIAKLYWLGPEKWRALGLLAILLALLAAYTQLSVQLNEQQGEMVSALSQTDSERFWRNVWLFLGVLGLYVPIFAGYRYLRSRLGLAWRRWATARYLDRYMSDRSFYDAL